jgi:hypothetical protein
MESARPDPIGRRAGSNRGAAGAHGDLGLSLADGALRLLRDAPCPACVAALEAERLYQFWFVNESRTDTKVKLELAAAVGWCSAHTRAMLAVMVPRVATSVFADLVRRVSHTLAADPAPSTGRCPACLAMERAATAAIATVMAGVDDLTVQAEYRRSFGFCAAHTRQACTEASALASTVMLVETLSARLADRSFSVSALVPPDNDARRRADARFAATRTSAEAPPAATRGVAQLRKALLADCCPVCRAATETESRLLAWIPGAWRSDGEAVEREYAATCRVHLFDLSTFDQSCAAALTRLKAIRLRGVVAGCHERLEPLVGRRRVRAGQIYDAAEPFLRGEDPCPVCREFETATARWLRLVEAGLLDPVTRHAYEGSFGICVRHLIALGDRPPALAREIVVARLASVGWELDEALRKQRWDSRFEPEGTEADAWSRSPALLDGRVYIGRPAPVASG